MRAARLSARKWRGIYLSLALESFVLAWLRRPPSPRRWSHGNGAVDIVVNKVDAAREPQD